MSSRSSASRQDIQDLVEAVRVLSDRVAALSLEAETAEREQVDFERGWEVVEESQPPCGTSSQQLRALHSLRGVEEGPPDTPLYCLDLAKRRLTGVDPGSDARSRRAFLAGYWAQVSLNCQVPYTLADSIGLPASHWILLRAGSRQVPVRFSKKAGYLHYIAGLPATQIVGESFPTITELSIFCVGAGCLVPQLKTWRKEK